MEKMFDRKETLLNIFGILERIYAGKVDSISTSYVANDISTLREESISFFRNALR